MSVTSTLVGVFVGAALSHGAAYVLHLRALRSKKSAILQEVDDLTAWADRHVRTLVFNLQLVELEQSFDSLPAEIKPFLFEQYFHEVGIHFKKWQRIALVDFYSLWAHFNHSVNSYISLYDNPSVRAEVNLYEKLRALYFTAWELKAKGPQILGIENATIQTQKGAQLEIDASAETQLAGALKEARELGPEKLRQKYYSG